MTKIPGSESGSESISQMHGSAELDPDPPQNVMDPQHWFRLVGCEDSGGAAEPVVLHCLYGEPAHTFLGAMSRFLAANPREFLILDFQHLYKFSCQDHAAILHRVQTLFGSRICPCPARQASNSFKFL
jgi:hypothetical protein